MIFPHNITEAMDLMPLTPPAVVVNPDDILVFVLFQPLWNIFTVFSLYSWCCEIPKYIPRFEFSFIHCAEIIANSFNLEISVT